MGGLRVRSAVVFALLLGCAASGAHASEPLSTSEPSQVGEPHKPPPTPPKRNRSLPSARVIDSGPRVVRRIALTLDDGYRADTRILDLTETLGISGTAFLVGEAAETSPWLVRRLLAGGWEICSHTWSHRVLPGLSASAIEREITRGADAVEAISGTTCPYFRPPFGRVNDTVLRVADELGYRVVTWDASISDSTPASTRSELQIGIALGGIRPGAILLGHFGGTHSYEVLEQVLPAVLADGYAVGTVSELLSENPVVEVTPGSDDEATLVAPASLAVSARVPPGAWAGLAYLSVGLILASFPAALGRRRIRVPEVVSMSARSRPPAAARPSS